MKPFPFKLPLILDGAVGTHLIKSGLPAGVCVEQWIIEHPEIIKELQRAYVAAGTNAVYAPTFGANRAKLASYGLENDVDRINREIVAITRDAVGNDVAVGGDISPTGLFIEPYGDAHFDDIVEIYREQISALVGAGVDFIIFETMLSLWECRAGLIAAADFDIPVFVTITVDSNGKTLMGTSLLPCVVTLQALGAAAVGINCSEGPEGLAEQFASACAAAQIPLIAKPNAGRPDPDNPEKFDLSAQQFAACMTELAEAGASVFGGCCGTSPEHIAAISGLEAYGIKPCSGEFSANECCAFFLPDFDRLTLSEPMECNYDLEDNLIDMDDESVGAAEIRISSAQDAAALSEAARMARLPIAIVSDDPAALEQALRLYHGRAIIDRKCDIDIDILKSLAEKYGALIY